MRTKLSLAFVLIATVLVAWWWMPRNTAGSAAARVESVGTTSPATHEQGLAAIGADLRDADGAREIVASKSAATNEIQGAQRKFELIPVTGADKRRVARAELTWIAFDPVDERAETPGSAALRRGALDTLLDERGAPIRPDAEGRFFVPEPSEGMCVVARAPGLWGYVDLSKRFSFPCLLPMEADRSAVVLVVAPSGEPIPGARVAVRKSGDSDVGWERAHALTDATGVARLNHLQAILADPWDHSYRYTIALAEPLAQPVEAPLDPALTLGEPITLVMPPTGEVLLQVDGATPATVAGLKLLATHAREDVSGRGEPTGTRALVDGQVLFPFVGLGCDVLPHTGVADTRAHVSARAPGPTRAGERVTLRVSSAQDQFLLRGRLVHTSGKPLDEEHVDLWFSTSAAENWSAHLSPRIRTLRDGRFSISLPRHGRLRQSVHLDFNVDRSMPVTPLVRRFTLALEEREFDLGALEVPADWLDVLTARRFPEQAPLILAGRVLSIDGEPQAHVDVYLYRGGATSPAGATNWERAGLATSDATGHFEFRGTASGPVFARAFGAAACSPFQRFSAGFEDAELVLSGSATLRGRILFSGPFVPLFLRVAAQRRGVSEDTPYPDKHSARIDSEGVFVLEQLAAGLWDVTIEYGSLEEPLATIEGVRIEAGATNVDPRLDPFDLANEGRWREVLVLDPTGAPCRQVFVCGPPLVPDGEARSQYSRTGKILLDRDEGPVWISNQLDRSLRIDPATCDDTVQLKPAARIVVSAAADLEWPEDCEIRIELVTSPAGECDFDDPDDDEQLLPGEALELECYRHTRISLRARVCGARDVEFPCTVVGLPTLPPDELPAHVTVSWDRAAVEAAAKLARQ
ncbi:MAG: carboxypeptidase regulatory-like domain-containing protein [Planctomycetes bacterium]|nr:carboxypeptidase regulatory-like domain-containing protein [Planctomycetota bacterium]